MPRFAANLSMMFNEVPFLDRFAASAKAGFEGVEFLFPYEHPAAEIRKRLTDSGLTQVLFNMPPGAARASGSTSTTAVSATIRTAAPTCPNRRLSRSHSDTGQVVNTRIAAQSSAERNG